MELAVLACLTFLMTRCRGVVVLWCCDMFDAGECLVCVGMLLMTSVGVLDCSWAGAGLQATPGARPALHHIMLLPPACPATSIFRILPHSRVRDTRTRLILFFLLQK